ncbi:hypothetical protein D1007_54644 [Hordeum vulgare]|nr:hypothetical protein D1007_54644 [Hordeum vulgare]
MMLRVEVDYYLSWEKSAPHDPHEGHSAGFFNQLDDDLAVYQQRIRKEVEAKGYVVDKNDDEEAANINRVILNSYKEAYLEHYGTLPSLQLLNDHVVHR